MQQGKNQGNARVFIKTESSQKQLIFSSPALKFLFIFGCVFILTFEPFQSLVGNFTFDPKWANGNADYIVDTTGCKILNLDPSPNDSILFFKPKRVESFKKCSAPFVLIFNWTVKMNPGNGFNNDSSTLCCLRELKMRKKDPQENSRDVDAEFAKWEFLKGKECRRIHYENWTQISFEFIQVECEIHPKLQGKNSKDKPTIYYDHFALVSPLKSELKSESTQRKMKFWDEQSQNSNSIQEKQVPPNVIVIGLDSTSRLHMLRSLLQTKKLLDAQDFIDMNGHTKVGVSTLPNMMAALTGLLAQNGVDSFPCWETPVTPLTQAEGQVHGQGNRRSEVKVENCPFIWKEFSKTNYITARVEDQNTFIHAPHEGAENESVDFNIAPLSWAFQETQKRTWFGPTCTGGMRMDQVIFKYILDFVREMKKKKYPFFLYSWQTFLGHFDFNGVARADETIKEFFMELIKEIGENSVIIFMSDHGYVYNPFRETFQGFFEDSLPFLSVRLPPSFKTPDFVQKHGDWYKNLKQNSVRLTSHLDLHLTLQDVARLSSSSLSLSQSNSIKEKEEKLNPQRHLCSFFDPIPENRSCESALIPLQFCRCGITNPPEVISAEGIKVSKIKAKPLKKFLIDTVNKIIGERSKVENVSCKKLVARKILYSREMEQMSLDQNQDQEHFSKDFKDYVLAIETMPSAAHYEARLRHHKSNHSITLISDIYRINSYENQSYCVKKDDFLKKLCYCQLPKL